MLKYLQTIAVILLLGSVVAALDMAQPAVVQLESWDLATYEDDLFAAIAQAHDLLDLKDTSLPAGYREIRIRGHLSDVCCWPTPMLRLVQGPDCTRGELLLFRRLFLKAGNPAQRADEHCVPLHDQHVCVRTWPLKSSDWASVAKTLEELGAWSISESCEIKRNADGSVEVSGIGDAGSIYIQRLVGTVYSTYSCNAPSVRTTPVGQKANEIYKYFYSLVGTIPHENDAIAP
jgi:hypothetical protein